MPTVFFEHTALRAIARHLLEKHPGGLAVKRAVGRSTSMRPNLTETRRVRRKRLHRGVGDQAPARVAPQPIAIVGIAGRFPGSANVDEFWRHLEANHDLISEVP